MFPHPSQTAHTEDFLTVAVYKSAINNKSILLYPHLHIKGQVTDKDCPVALIHDTAASAAMCTLTGPVYTNVQAFDLHGCTGLSDAPGHCAWKGCVPHAVHDNVDL